MCKQIRTEKKNEKLGTEETIFRKYENEQLVYARVWLFDFVLRLNMGNDGDQSHDDVISERGKKLVDSIHVDRRQMSICFTFSATKKNRNLRPLSISVCRCQSIDCVQLSWQRAALSFECYKLNEWRPQQISGRVREEIKLDEFRNNYYTVGENLHIAMRRSKAGTVILIATTIPIYRRLRRIFNWFSF